ncbi:hypothetical protein CRUP_029836 [Coryphaenoides rupestris]|nr:hypothetical protein CRUP_029836 [Coryphaenoides rupestris]
MGNTTSCCVSSSPKHRRRSSSSNHHHHSRLEPYRPEAELRRDDTACNLQHISDRENIDDLPMEYNPSDHPRASTIFLSKSQTDVREKRKSLYINHCLPRNILPHQEQKSEVPQDYEKHNPEQKQIYRFVRTLFSAAQLTAECAIVTLLDICPANWKRIALGAILLASKVWDDQAVWNVDYCQILKDITVEDIVYAKYYFDLRSLAEDNNLSFPLEPLSRDKALKLEAISRLCDDPYKDIRKSAKKRSVSADNLAVPSSPNAGRPITAPEEEEEEGGRVLSEEEEEEEEERW